jgi:nitrate/nitrite transporter NarK
MAMTENGRRYSVLTMNTMAFTVNFAIWTMFSIIGIRIKAQLGLNPNSVCWWRRRSSPGLWSGCRWAC